MCGLDQMKVSITPCSVPAQMAAAGVAPSKCGWDASGSDKPMVLLRRALRKKPRAMFMTACKRPRPADVTGHGFPGDPKLSSDLIQAIAQNVKSVDRRNAR
jgi:hypothetical protein